jgi:TonB family protein
MVKTGVILSFLVPAIALAQPVPPAAVPGQAAAPRHLQNDCTSLYPQSAVQAGEEGITIISVHVSAGGTVNGPRVARSSGYPDLDNAALACVNGVKVAPLLSGGVPIEADTDMQVTWRRSTFQGVPATINGVVCPPAYPPLAVRLHHEGETNITYTIGANGWVKNLTVTKSSGYDELDKAVTNCFSQSVFWPVMQQGHGVEIDRKLSIKWRLPD